MLSFVYIIPQLWNGLPLEIRIVCCRHESSCVKKDLKQLKWAYSTPIDMLYNIPEVVSNYLNIPDAARLCYSLDIFRSKLNLTVWVLNMSTLNVTVLDWYLLLKTTLPQFARGGVLAKLLTVRHIILPILRLFGGIFPIFFKSWQQKGGGSWPLHPPPQIHLCALAETLQTFHLLSVKVKRCRSSGLLYRTPASDVGTYNHTVHVPNSVYCM